MARVSAAIMLSGGIGLEVFLECVFRSAYCILMHILFSTAFLP